MNAMNSYGLAQVWAQGDAVSHAVALLLIAMSLAAWTVIVLKGWAVLRARGMRRAAARFWHTETLEEGVALLEPRAGENPFHDLVMRSIDAAAHHESNRDELHGVLNLSDWLTSNMRQAIDDAAVRQQAGLSVLASVGSTAPFVGLFGTVWGIYHALAEIGRAGAASLDQVAGPVGEALVMTALGLAVAIPAVLAYNALTRSNKALIASLRHFAHDLHAYLVTGGRWKKASLESVRAPNVPSIATAKRGA